MDLTLRIEVLALPSLNNMKKKKDKMLRSVPMIAP